MGCRSDYMEPSQAEENSRNIADMIVFLSFRLAEQQFDSALEKFNTDFEVILNASEAQYGDKENLEAFTQILCKLCSDMTEQDKDNYIYCGRIAESRKLADWWDEHQEADKKRLAEEREVKSKAQAAHYGSKEYKLQQAVIKAKTIQSDGNLEHAFETLCNDVATIGKG